MNNQELKALEAIARLYEAAPSYLLNKENKKQLERALIEAIDRLDIVEYSRTKNSFLSTIQKEVPYHRKRTILDLIDDRHLTPREGHVLRYLGNGHNPSYIAKEMGISIATARSHTYSIYRKLGVHSKAELKSLLSEYDLHRSTGISEKSPCD